jgi:L,D-transpeptidase YcbB
VVVGKVVEKLRTPVFSADLTHIVFRPYWDVPRSIMLAEILPAIRQEPKYLARKRLELVDSSGKATLPDDPLTALASGSVRVRQLPGPGNALGTVKFMLPNQNNVYLHDTPDKQLFSRSTRAFSHGCIRVAAPAILAQWLLGNDPAWTAERIAGAMDGKEPLQVNLAEPVRVYIVYGTAIAREDGTVLFLDDLYGLD